MKNLIDFSDPCLRTFLPVLLQDHTTGKDASKINDAQAYSRPLMHKVTRLKYMTLTQSLIPTTVVLRGLQVAAFVKT
jgi:hypothetical protein